MSKYYTNLVIIFSIKHKSVSEINCDSDALPQNIKANEKDIDIIFTYSVVWEVCYYYIYLNILQNIIKNFLLFRRLTLSGHLGGIIFSILCLMLIFNGFQL